LRTAHVLEDGWAAVGMRVFFAGMARSYRGQVQ